MTEVSRQFTRIISNYLRLLITLGLGIAVVPLTIRWLGDDAFGLISLLGANIGLAGIFRQIIQQSLVRELAQSFHQGDDVFRRCYAAIFQIALLCAFLSVLSFLGVLLLLPMFKLPDGFETPARWFIIGQGAFTCVMVITAPLVNMFLVKERFIQYNIWFILGRAGNILSVIILGYVIVIDDPAQGLKLHGLLWSAIASLILVFASVAVIRDDKRLMPTFRGADKESRSGVVSTFTWNTAVQVAMNLHEQVPPFLLNFFGGTLANAAWGVGFRFVAYIRMCTTGIQFGSDAVSARLASDQDGDKVRKQLQALIGVQTKMTAVVAIPAAAVIVVYGWPIFNIWVGGSLKNYELVMPVAVYISKILAIALASRAISDTWMLILYGAGYVRQYAPWIFAGGIFAPVSSLIIMLMYDGQYQIYVPSVLFALVFLVVHLFGLPLMVSKCLHIPASKLLSALIRPSVATVVSMLGAIGVLILGGAIDGLGFAIAITKANSENIDYVWIIASIMVFAIVYAALTWSLVLSKGEREMITKSLLRR